MADEPEADEGIDEDTVFSSERAKAFIDAVVAIAMTLLILPLMESVGESAGADHGGAQWLEEHQQQLVSFVLSFVIIAMFWINHHRVYARVDRVTSGLLWLTMPWLLSIVWLPVATALSGQMSSEDAVVKALYIGSMIATSIFTILLRLYLRAHPQLHHIDEVSMKRGLAAELSMTVLFAIALVVGVVWPQLGYYPLFLMALTGPAQAFLARTMGLPPEKRRRSRAS